MSRRSRRRAEQLERSVAEAQAARAADAAQADRLAAERTAAHEDAMARTRAAYDVALSESGVVLFQQTSPGVDAFHLSASMAAVLGWDVAAFVNPGILRGMVHPDDLDTLATVLPPDHPGPIAESSAGAPAADGLATGGMSADGVTVDGVTADGTGPDSAQTGQNGSVAAPNGVEPAADGTPLLNELSVIDLTTGTASPLIARTDPIDATSRPAVTEDSEVTVRFRSAQGAWHRMLVRVVAPDHGVVDDPTRIAEMVLKGTLVDVTDGERHRTTARRFAELVEHDPSGCLVLEFLDPAEPGSLTVRAANPAARRMLDLERRVVDGTSIDTVFADASAQLIRSALFDVYHTGESMTAERLSFSEVPGTYLDLRVDRLSDGTIAMTIRDVTGTVAVEERLRHQASHDALTGLPNRTLLEERLAVATDTVTHSSPVALIVIDVDQLRLVNESYGLNLGDQLLIDIGRRLVRDVRGTAIVSRLGGDEFAVLTLGCSSEAEALERAAAVAGALSRPFDVAGHLVECTVSIGVALAPSHGEDWRTLLRHANTAMQVHKRRVQPTVDLMDSSADGPASSRGRGARGALGAERDHGFTVFRRTEDSSSIRRLAVLSELRQGLANNELELRYQPQIDLRSGRVTKLEAVLRWQRDEDSARMPMEFLELAEHSGLIQPLTRWILGETARAATLLSGPSRPGGDSGTQLVISTNLSVRNLFDPDLFTFVELLVRSGELRPELVELEVSETELMDDPVRSQEVLARLSALGLRFVVDEFGTGYTSLATMQHLPVVGLKIDRSYVANVATVPADAAIVRSTIELSHELGLMVSADGVGDAATLARLAEFGCDMAQGFHLSGPVTLEQLSPRIAELESAVRGWIGSTDSARI